MTLALLSPFIQRHARMDVAVSGGVDSLTLAVAAQRALPGRVRAFHASSAAVPRGAGERTRALMHAHGIPLVVVDAGEVNDPVYRANPIDRCFTCKSHLYQALDAHARAVGADGVVASGTNASDLGEFRPGLRAAAAHAVVHPFVEAGMHKREVRALARELALGDIADLPAAPCLASRIETGIAIDEQLLACVDEVESVMRVRLPLATAIRCRVRHSGVVIEIDSASLATLAPAAQHELIAAATRALSHTVYASSEVRLESYKTGSAFLQVLAD